MSKRKGEADTRGRSSPSSHREALSHPTQCSPRGGGKEGERREGGIGTRRTHNLSPPERVGEKGLSRA